MRFVSRSFANEYLKQKNNFSAKITERNINANLKKMFDMASHIRTRKIVSIGKVITLRDL